MADSKRERISKNVQTTLGGITLAGGYQNDLSGGRVQRILQSGQVFANGATVVIAEGPESPEDTPNPLTQKELMYFLMLSVRIDDEGGDARAGDEVLNSYAADIEKALMEDHTRGGLAIDTSPLTQTEAFIEDKQPEIGRIVQFTVRYRHQREDPLV